MRDATFDIDRVQPLARSIFSGGRVDQRARIEPGGVLHPSVVRRDPLGRRDRDGPGHGDAPDVHFLRLGNTADEVDEATVWRPRQKVVVNARLRTEYPPGIASVPVRDEDGIARIVGVIREARSIGRPDGIHTAFDKAARRAAHDGCQP